MTERTAIVVGGGLAGLAMTAALVRRGWRVTVLERSPVLGEAGAGISLWPNALRALDEIGVGHRVRALGGPELGGGIRSRTGRWLARAEGDPEVAPLMLHRADLLQALADAVPADAIRLGVTVTSIVDDADLVVGADGLNSAVRHRLWPNAAPPRYSGYTAWRLVTGPVNPRPAEPAGAETWGVGTRFGYAGLPDGRFYCYATANRPEGETGPDAWAELRQRFGDWHEPIPSLLAAAEGMPVLRHDIYDLPDLPSYMDGHTALIGDAAHAMTPNLGQGAGQAFEDVATLAALLDERPDIPSALRDYDAIRRLHTQSVVRMSRRVGRLGQWSNPVAVAARDRLLPLLPASAMARSLAPILTWHRPTATSRPA